MNEKINVVIAEDDYYSRELLKGMLVKFNDFEVIGEAENGNQLIEITKKLQPHLIFVDIDMPELDGMNAAKEISIWNSNIYIVFVTGHTDFAIEAFEISTIDYILKPFDLERLEKTIEKARIQINGIMAELNYLAKVLTSVDKLLIKSEHEILFIDTSSIIFIERDKIKRKSLIHTQEGQYETYESLTEIENKLQSKIFFRSHKSYIINLKKINKIVPWGDSSYLVILDKTYEAYISKNKAQLLYQILNKNND